jgi:tetratricopeptide (TPR) repeat protein
MIRRKLARVFGWGAASQQQSLPEMHADSDFDVLRRAIESGDLCRARDLESVLPQGRSRRADILVLRGRIALDSGNIDLAATYIEEALGKRPDLADAHVWRAVVHMHQGSESNALVHALEAERLKPGNAEMRSLIGVLNYNQNDLIAALTAFEAALEVDSTNVNAHRNLATIYFKLQDWSKAAHHFRRLSDIQPDLAFAWQGHASSLFELGREQEAWPLYSRATELAGRSSDAYRDYAVALFNDGQIDAARLQFESGLNLDPESPILHVGHAACEFITHGSTAEGWNEYEWRQTLDEARYGVRTKSWNGSPNSGRRLLVYAEQGIGDVLMFARYLPFARHAVKEMVVQIPPVLARLMRMSAATFNWNVSEWVERDTRIEPHEAFYDHEIPLLSLIRVCGFPINRVSRAYLDVDADLVRHWGQRLGERRPDRLRVGLVWAGNPRRIDDALRCILPEQLAPLRSASDVDFVSLQMEAKPQYKNSPLPFPITDPTSDIRDFADTAAIMRNLDLVLSIDTAAAHLAGAIGVPCWVLLSKMPDWRWQMADETQPWYGSLRSFVVERNRQWMPLIERVAHELRSKETLHFFRKMRA